MSETHKPRHIRDIAHLYLSRIERKDTTRRKTLLIAAERRGYLSAFHVINIAAAFATKQIAVRVHELSRLHPNAGYYLMLPPNAYLCQDSVESSVLQPALAGIDVCFGVSKTPESEGGEQNLLFDIIHLPPLEWADEFSEVAGTIKHILSNEAFFLLLGGPLGEVEAHKRFIDKSFDSIPIYTLGVMRWKEPHPAGGTLVHDLGTIENWRSQVGDRIPALLREPRSKLARTYDSLSESLLCKVQSKRRKTGATNTG